MDSVQQNENLPMEVMSEDVDVQTVKEEKQAEDSTGMEKEVLVESEKGDEFGYLKRNEFTSEIYKIEIRKLYYFGVGELKKLLRTTLNLDVCKIKAPTGKDFAYACCRSQEVQEKALQVLNGYKWKGKILQAVKAKPSADPLQRKRKEEESDGVNHASGKKQKTSAEATCPLADLSYENQLKEKDAQMQKLIGKFINDLKKCNKDAKAHLENFKYEGIVGSPQIDEYRNKCEFTVGKNSNGALVVGFRLGSYVDGSLEVSEVDTLPHIPKSAKWAANTFQEFVRQSKFEVFNPEANTGHFKQLMVRTSSVTQEIMLMPGIYSSNLKEEDLKEVKRDLVQYYEKLAADEQQEFKCTSLYYQDVQPRKPGQKVSPVEHLMGATHIRDMIHNLEFRISPMSFFQVNTASANVLYQKVIDLAAPKDNTTVLDICCGTGTIALAFAKHCNRVLGVEIVRAAVLDAEYNAEKNNITNYKFYAGNADKLIKTMVHEAYRGSPKGRPADIVAVIDPPRPGLHNRSILGIRAFSSITRVVYISCNPQLVERNWINLCRPESKQYRGAPFYPTKAVAVDMFPHTRHTEMIVLFERKGREGIMSKKEIKQKHDEMKNENNLNGENGNKQEESEEMKKENNLNGENGNKQEESEEMMEKDNLNGENGNKQEESEEMMEKDNLNGENGNKQEESEEMMEKDNLNCENGNKQEESEEMMEKDNLNGENGDKQEESEEMMEKDN